MNLPEEFDITIVAMVVAWLYMMTCLLLFTGMWIGFSLSAAFVTVGLFTAITFFCVLSMVRHG